MKRRIGPIIAILISVVIFVVLVIFSDTILGDSQKDMFTEETVSYQELKKNHDPSEAARIAGLDYVDSSKENTYLQKKAYDMFHRGRIAPGKNYVTDVNFGERIMYYLPGSSRYVVAKRYNRLWSQAPLTFILVALMYFVITDSVILFYYRKRQILSNDIKSVTENLRRVRKNKEMASLILSPDDELYGLVEQTNKISMDINDLRDDVRLRERRFRGLVGHLPIGVMLLNSQGDVLMHNQAMAGLLDVNISNDIHPFIEDIKTYSLSRMIEHTLRKNKNHHREIQLVGNSQKFVDANVIRLVHTREDFDQQVLVILYDLTESRQIERMQVDFVNNVSHELKTPVTSIEGFSETLLNGAKDDPEKLDHFLKIIHSESIRLTELIQDILSLSRVKKGNYKAEMVNLREDLDSILERQDPAIKKHNLTIKKQFFGNEDVTINKEKLNLVIRNLIKNAISYNKENGEIDIEVHHDEIENRLKFIIKDTGIGISEADQGRIFERFYRVDRSRSLETGGTGLGLAIVKETLDTLDGDIRMESHKGLGTTFTVNIPL
ncbi:sensor histidine kinase [Companilactobacillus bobalius]|uniref:histidine kinase n=2 Tax=Companilactobacillus bobalius TaxID=2801451 RepID=A0A202FD95_9LACO|nr:ATP-binding protein [Companilactobacillus bobalius]KAE9561789.1 histidine kinase [Companilactobacillus bobalius]KRK82710.1 two component sensor transduction histidine kinase [Companilactobacillus bobalius DSM 19674]OVE98417.1 Histidine kinase [Companilactobacillus bobalius]GEO57541.1 signal transduction histidine kinase [Companilactobacillus paralimentarius]